MLRCMVVVPTYNERENIVRIIPAILEQGQEFNILVVDDNSPDGTGAVVDEIASNSNGRVQVLHRSGKLGLGTAYMQGFRYALQQGYDYIFEMDADFSHKPEYLPELLKAARKTGVAAGSRNIAGGGVENWPLYRKLISRGGSFYSRAVLGLKIKDCTGGFKCFSRATLQTLNLEENIKSTGFGFQVEVNCLCEWNGFTITEVPIIFPDRTAGKSKMSQKIFLEALLNVWKLRARQPELRNAHPSYASADGGIPASEIRSANDYDRVQA